MSIATQKGDDGTTSLLFNRRVPKDHPRVEACGSCDELNSAIGQAKVLAAGKAVPSGKWIGKHLHEIQKDLMVLMSELATLPKDRKRRRKTGRHSITPADVNRLTRLVHQIESENICFRGWIIPGGTPSSATLDMARAVCRRAERCVAALRAGSHHTNPNLLKYLNRLSDLLWLMARKAESRKK